MGTFVRRLTALTVIWLLATAALTYAAASRHLTPPAASTPPTTTTETAAETTMVVPDVSKQAYVFAEGTLGDAGFGWVVKGSVKGFAANLVESQSPKAGTVVVDTGNPTVTLTLSHPAGAKQTGLPQNASPVAGTALRLPGQTAKTAAKKPAKAKAASTSRSVEGVKAPAAKKPVAKKPAAKKPAHRWPQNRPPAFSVTGARKEPLDEMPLTDRATMLLHWIEAHPKPTNADVKYWLYQHAWIVTGARFGWWQGAEALQTLLVVDQKAQQEWGIGAKSAEVARAALAYAQKQAK